MRKYRVSRVAGLRHLATAIFNGQGSFTSAICVTWLPPSLKLAEDVRQHPKGRLCCPWVRSPYACMGSRSQGNCGLQAGMGFSGRRVGWYPVSCEVHGRWHQDFTACTHWKEVACIRFNMILLLTVNHIRQPAKHWFCRAYPHPRFCLPMSWLASSVSKRRCMSVLTSLMAVLMSSAMYFTRNRAPLSTPTAEPHPSLEHTVS